MSFLGMDIGWGELLIILIVALLVVGPDKLPMYARKTARFVRNVQKVTTGLTGQFTKAMNLDDDGDSASGLKKDLIEVKKSLEKDVADLKATLDSQAKAVSESVESGTKDAAAALRQNARDISDTLNTEAAALKSTLDAQAKAVSETVESGAKQASKDVPQAAAGAYAPVEGDEQDIISAPRDTPFQSPIGQAESVHADLAKDEAEAS